MCSDLNFLIEAILMSIHNIPSSVCKRKSPEIIPNNILSAVMGLSWLGTLNEFEIAVRNEPSVLQPLKFYCI